MIERCKTLEFRKDAFDTLEQIFKDNSNDKGFLGGFERNEIRTVFDRFEYQIDRRIGGAVIRTRIGLYIENQNWLDNLEPIGYYELETSMTGEVLDDRLVIEKEKYLKDIGIISHFQSINEKLPTEYLRRNHIQYEFVSYISMVGMLFISKQFEGAGQFIQRAYSNLEKIDSKNFDQEYLKEAKMFLRMISCYLTTNNLVKDSLKNELNENRNCG